MDIKTVLAGIIGVLVLELLWKESPTNDKFSNRLNELKDLLEEYNNI